MIAFNFQIFKYLCLINYDYNKKSIQILSIFKSIESIMKSFLYLTEINNLLKPERHCDVLNKKK